MESKLRACVKSGTKWNKLHRVVREKLAFSDVRIRARYNDEALIADTLFTSRWIRHLLLNSDYFQARPRVFAYPRHDASRTEHAI